MSNKTPGIFLTLFGSIKARRFTRLDGLLLLVFSALIGIFAYRIAAHLQYDWQWEKIPQFLFRYDTEAGQWVPNYLIHGLLTTVRLGVWSGLLAIVLGQVVALARVSRWLYWRLMARSYIELMRNLPPLVIIFILYFFLADQLVPILDLQTLARQASPQMQQLITLLFAAPDQFSAFFSAVITLALFESAYVAEILRAGIESVERGQWDASHALGLTRLQTLQHIILPQAVRRVLPPLAGQMISLIKDSAIVSVISIQELTYQGTQLMASTYLTIEVWLTIAVLYFLLTFPCSLIVGRMDRTLNRQ
ncbi:amino acid ABC transporter permease [Desulfobulbus oligotrophicus]|uniref:amino acid ABC transporter permease n=1 Tax=Desulfobulbus oligotrophicus TaxID=1909699 RepID=UPI0018EF0250|nr:amino acid ABC transporter permease [Desulfobulbus oligotrophicus]MDY0391026.1 amino acid ABC transporter permease [Desulfobulbus oligotrophicus]